MLDSGGFVEKKICTSKTKKIQEIDEICQFNDMRQAMPYINSFVK